MIKFTVWLIWDFTGLRFVWERIRPPIDQKTQKRPPATFMIWAIGALGLYIALFGLAFQRYKNRIDIIEYRANSIFIQLATPVSQKAINRIPVVQNMRCPPEPDLLKPHSILNSLLSEDAKYDEMVNLLKKTIEDLKRGLNSVNLNQAILDRSNLIRANLNKASLQNANLQGSDLGLANLQSARLRNANLQGAFLGLASLMQADLRSANFKQADLGTANLKEANLKNAIFAEASLKGVNFEGAKNLTANQLCESRSLSEAKLDSDLLMQVKEKCPDLLESP